MFENLDVRTDNDSSSTSRPAEINSRDIWISFQREVSLSLMELYEKYLNEYTRQSPIEYRRSDEWLLKLDIQAEQEREFRFDLIEPVDSLMISKTAMTRPILQNRKIIREPGALAQICPANKRPAWKKLDFDADQRPSRKRKTW